MGTRSGLPLCGVLAITDKNWEETRVLLGIVARINIRRNGSSKGEAKLNGVFYTQHQELLRPWLCCGCSTPSWGSLERLSWQRAVWSRIFQNAFLKYSIAVLALGCVSMLVGCTHASKMSASHSAARKAHRRLGKGPRIVLCPHINPCSIVYGGCCHLKGVARLKKGREMQSIFFHQKDHQL